MGRLDIAARLRMARENAGITQEEAAQLISVKPQSISNYERAISRIDSDSLIILCEKYGVSVEWVLVGSKPSSDSSLPSGLSSDESALLNGYRSLSRQGKEYMQQTLAMAMNTYKKTDCISNVESEDA
ncbi:MAG: helix-turn-helix transcriptional regulator [Eubacteriales bacterium]|nr:helix-turn-helix transcriptional regulator [Eubacteriales bacterium]